VPAAVEVDETAIQSQSAFERALPPEVEQDKVK
jgi:hypothetical protein